MHKFADARRMAPSEKDGDWADAFHADVAEIAMRYGVVDEAIATANAITDSTGECMPWRRSRATWRNRSMPAR